MANIYTNDPHEFWGDGAWPSDDPMRGYTFLARAMLDIGRVLFRDEWIGTEPYLSLTPRALPRPFPSIPQPLRLPILLEAKAEDAKAAPDEPWWKGEFGTSLAAPEPRVIERDEEGDRMLAEARARWDRVMDETARSLNASGLKSAWRPLLGGAYYDIPDTDWNSENPFVSWAPRFLLCRIDPRRTFTNQPAGPAFIYVRTASLQEFLAQHGQPHAAALPAPPAPVVKSPSGQSDQTRFAKEALLLCFPPHGIVPAMPSIKANMRSVEKKFAEITADSPQVGVPSERKWRDIRAGKYGAINGL